MNIRYPLRGSLSNTYDETKRLRLNIPFRTLGNTPRNHKNSIINHSAGRTIHPSGNLKTMYL